ncbi:hypothetical protein DTL42_15790 [Bremerella cremea]|uniref:Carboxypeptidase regulatory-like domain-containing protein n=1 Tax=Bremerella cremea TaxID=1031537 RepID=A0A368KS17_9BACT|nr:hypothetical protein [Bremerella cremea]RCS46418.1 hypothetical protein DTL42_15790 [Bremerella cremea]
MYRFLFSGLVLLVATTSWGCGSQGAFDTSPVHGKVTFEGEPVIEGTIDFLPIAASDSQEMGKPAAATIAEDGTYSAGTYASGDGVVPGRKRVQYSAPLPEDTRENAGKKPSPYVGFEIEPTEIEVQSGDNEIDFVLTKPKKSR